jgi:hypothetical protein
MLDLVDLLLLRRGIPTDDRELTFRRIDGNASSKVLYFLPWHTPFGIARQIGIMPLDFSPAEMPASVTAFERSVPPSNGCPGNGRAAVVD